jgi:hypothetical protein
MQNMRTSAASIGPLGCGFTGFRHAIDNAEKNVGVRFTRCFCKTFELLELQTAASIFIVLKDERRFTQIKRL